MNQAVVNFGEALANGLTIGLTGARTAEQQAAADEDLSLFVVEAICDALERAGCKRI